MLNCCKFMFRRLRILNSNVLYKTIGHNYCISRKELILNEIYNASNTFLNTQNVSVSTKLKRKAVVSSINDLVQYISDGNQFYLKLLINILNTIDFENISNSDAKLLLECCGSSVADSSRQARNNICQDVYKSLLKHNKLDLDVYHTYISVCTDNDIVLNSKEFLTSIKLEPNKETYKLLLNNVCEKGHIEQAFELLDIMKNKSISADEEVFNNLLLAHTIRGGLKSGESVLRTMKVAQVTETTTTKFCLLRGVSKRDNFDDFQSVLQKYPFDITETQLLNIIEIFGLNGNTPWLPKIRNLYSDTIITREFIIVLEKICIHLVHMDKYEAAMAIYEEFVKPSTDKNYGFFLFKEMLHCNVDIGRIISLAKHLIHNNLNTNVLENLTEIALRHNYIEASWKLLGNLPELRPHFFWPLLLNSYQKGGETGIYDVLTKMVNLGVKVDSETLQFYVLPFCNLDNPEFLIKKFQDLLGITVTEILNSVLVVLLRNNQAKLAADLCNNYKVRIFGDKLFRLFSSTWKATKDTTSIVLLLQRYCESNPNDYDLIGDFLSKTLSACRTSDDFVEYLKLLMLIHKRDLRINSASTEILYNLCSTRYKNGDVIGKIKESITALLDFGLKPKPEALHIPHPRDMNIDELECHLLELQEKNMETRGVLRKLIQFHAKAGNLRRIEDLRQQFFNAGYNESVGMKSSLMHSYVQGGHIDAALNIYNEIKSTNPHFKIDNFKIIDLATLLIKENKFNEAMAILRTETETNYRTTSGGPTIEKNCWQLLGSFKSEDEQLQMFNYLIEKGYCKPTNVILGPLVRIHLNRDLDKTADTYINYASKYKCTPLQLEVVRAVLKLEDEVLLQKVLKATEAVHGSAPTQTVLIAALAENGQEKPLKKLFINNKIHIKEDLQRRCERWVQEGKIEALQTLANACQRLPKDVFDVNYVFNCILQIYNYNDDCKGAVKFYNQLLEEDVSIDKELTIQLKNLLKRCKFEVRNVNI